jgi:hypothetical protein
VNKENPNRRNFIKGILGSSVLMVSIKPSFARIPNNNPAKKYDLIWTEKLLWRNVLDITKIDGVGEFWDERLQKAQLMLKEKEGGVVFFPAGEYKFKENIVLQMGLY